MSLSSFKLSIPLKLMLVAIALVFPTVVLLYLLMTEKDVSIHFGAKEIQGNAYLAPLKNMMGAAPRHMLLNHQKLNFGGVTEAELKARQATVIQAIQQLRQADQAYGKGFADSQKLIAELESQWTQIQSKQAAMTTASNKEQHLAYLQKLRDAISYFGDQSNLILDPDLDTYYLMDLTLLRMPDISDNLYRLQLLVQEILKKESANANEKTNIVVLSGLIQSALKGLQTDVETAYANTKSPEALHKELDAVTAQSQKAVTEYLDFVEKQIRQGEPKAVQLATSVNLSDKALDAVFQLFDRSIAEEDKLIQARIDRFEQSKFFTMAWVALLILCILALGAYFIFGMIRAINKLNEAAKRVSDGYMDVEVQLNSGDELEVLAQSFNNMIAQNTQTLLEIDQARSQAENEKDTLSRLVEETTGSVTDIQTKSEIVSDNARIVAEAATEAASVSSTGEQAVSDSIESVNKIKQQIESVAEKILELSSRTQAISAITATVDDLAKQSKFLAFNASIEASKAGEFGKGFAIVANEIKNLSEESKGATEKIADILTEIQELTNTSVMLAEDATKLADIGVDLSNKAGSVIGQLVFSIENSAEAAYQISSSAIEQQNDLSQLAKSMEQLLVSGA